jgi:tetratricopeptide (TPR) repeat protein
MTDLTWPVGRCCERLAPLFLALVLIAPVQAQPLDTRLFADAADGELDEHDFISAALIASGVTDDCGLAQWQSIYGELRSAALASLKGSSLKERLAATKLALHERILVGRYRASASDLRTTIARGDYNCLTALVIHWDLCNHVGLSLEICSQPGHVNLRLVEGIEIEPSAGWRLADSASRACESRRLTPIELLGKFYYNRGVEQLRAGQFAEGLALLETSLQLDPADADARENLLAGLNNWAVEHCRQRRYDLAAPLIERGLSMEPAFAPLVANERLVRDRLQQ